MEDPRLIERALKGFEIGSAGIDYGMGMSNIDHTTGIRYGIISQHEVLQAWADSSEADYGYPEECECPECGKIYFLPKRKADWKWDDEFYCRHCKEHFEIELPDCNEPLGFFFKDDGYEATCGEDGDIFIIKSPYFTYCKFCSPCAPGAGYLMSPVEGGVKTYCFGKDWFDEEKVPYPVYQVSDRKRVV